MGICNGKTCLSHSLSETAGWYGDYASFVSSNYQWLLRGGYYGHSSDAGVFGYRYATIAGGPAIDNSFRLVMSPNS